MPCRIAANSPKSTTKTQIGPTDFADSSNTSWVMHCCGGLLVDLMAQILPEIQAELDMYLIEDKSWITMVDQVYVQEVGFILIRN